MKLMIDISEDLYNNMKSRFKYQNETDDNLSGFEKIGIAVKNGTPFEAQPTDKCKGCYYNDGEAHAECVVCDKGAQPTDAAEGTRDCKTCIHSDKGNCAYTEECHECMWESKYEQQPCEDCINSKRRKLNE